MITSHGKSFMQRSLARLLLFVASPWEYSCRYRAMDLLDPLGFVLDSEFYGKLDVIHNRCRLVLGLSFSVNTGSQQDGVPSMSDGAYVQQRIRM